MPDPRSPAAQTAMSSTFARAVDLSALKNRPAAPPTAGDGESTAPDATGTGTAGRAVHTSPYVVDITEETFEQVLQASTKVLVVVDLWADWCQPCKQLSPILEKLAADGHGTWILAKVDVDANPRISEAFQAQSIPTVVALANGQPVAAFSGAQPEPQVRQWIDSLIEQLREQLPGIKAAEDAVPEPEPEPDDPRFTAAEEATERGDHAGAAQAYQDILAAEPDNAPAVSGLAWAQLFARTEQAPADVVERSNADPADVSAAIAAADSEVVTGQASTGFARLITTIKVTADDDRTQARDHLLALFALFATDDADVNAARRALATALY